MEKQLDPKTLVERYKLMLRIRFHEEAIKTLFTRGMIGGTTHLYIGQEAIAAGLVAQLRKDDFISSTHRGHGHMLAKGGELRPMLAEILGRANGYCKGKGGSMHIASITLGNLGANGIVSGGLPIAVGSGISAQMRGTDQITVVSFGDGAANEGNTHESMNMASLWKLPVLFLFENNRYAVSTETSRSMAGNMEKRAAGYDLPFVKVDGNDLEAVHFAAQDAIAYVRSGKGPFVMQGDTYRIEGHYYGDAMVYRSTDEVDGWRKKDPIMRVEKLLTERGVMSEAEYQLVRAEIQQEVNEAVAFAEASPQPAPESIFEDVYTEWQA
ncbi:MAG: thiamine pyrophosphate-dependent dehydrogenase E1 component subunit alpha [Anaerolineaceae bacterium]|nr:thiamine pyrophosphate-dependent dehydrogenase E1 component subunit alpha [Anaerolineaceae bacterium]